MPVLSVSAHSDGIWRYKYVAATVDVKEEKLEVSLDKIQFKDYCITCDKLIDFYQRIEIPKFRVHCVLIIVKEELKNDKS
jgi:hypothetical protein